MVFRHYHHRDFEKKEQRRRAKRDLEGTELTLLEASLAGLGWGALWASGTGKKTSGGRPLHTACTLCTLCTLFKSGNTTEKQTSGFQSRKGGGIRTFKLREIRREVVKLG
jgi:hypothetical protein